MTRSGCPPPDPAHGQPQSLQSAPSAISGVRGWILPAVLIATPNTPCRTFLVARGARDHSPNALEIPLPRNTAPNFPLAISNSPVEAVRPPLDSHPRNRSSPNRPWLRSGSVHCPSALRPRLVHAPYILGTSSRISAPTHSLKQTQRVKANQNTAAKSVYN